MSRILVTGGAGFIGRHLVEHLAERGHTVRCLARRPGMCPAELHAYADVVRGDLESPATLAPALANIEVVYHLAGRTSAARARELYAVNGGGTAALMEACARQSTPPLVVHVSSLAAVGPAREGEPRREQDHPAPVSHYGRSKLAGEHAVRAWATRVPATIVRPGIVIGPRDRNTLPLFQSLAWTRIHTIPGLRLSRYSFIHVADLVELLTLAAERGARVRPADEGSAAGIYFAADREQPHGLELARLLAHSVQATSYLPLFLPALVVWIFGGVQEGLSLASGRAPALGLDKVREALAGNWAVSMVRAQRELGFYPSASLAERFAETAAWYRANGWLDWLARPAAPVVERKDAQREEETAQPAWEDRHEVSAT